MNKNFAIGTVVTIKGMERKVMIVGYLGVMLGDTLKMSDYVGVEYPTGENKLCFDHTDILEVHHMGYEDEVYAKFNADLLMLKNRNSDIVVGQEDGVQDSFVGEDMPDIAPMQTMEPISFGGWNTVDVFNQNKEVSNEMPVLGNENIDANNIATEDIVNNIDEIVSDFKFRFNNEMPSEPVDLADPSNVGVGQGDIGRVDVSQDLNMMNNMPSFEFDMVDSPVVVDSVAPEVKPMPMDMPIEREEAMTGVNVNPVRYEFNQDGVVIGENI